MKLLHSVSNKIPRVSLCFGVVVSTSLLLMTAGTLFYTKEVSGYHFALLGLAAAGILLTKSH